VVWPENAVQTRVDDPSYGPPLRGLARRGVPLLLGAPRSERHNGSWRHFNSALLLQPDTEPEHYDKRRLLPFSETQPLGELAGFGRRGDLDVGAFTAGEKLGLFQVNGATLGVLICMEALYPALAREAAREGATTLVNLSNDGWYRGSGGAWQHLAQAVFRAVETRRPLIRATTTGISAVVAPDGRLIASLGEGERGFLRTQVPPPWHGPSFYTRFGDVFALACVVVCVLGALLPRRDQDAISTRLRPLSLAR
jgi:apolipoprotein N-acyltransferase